MPAVTDQLLGWIENVRGYVAQFGELPLIDQGLSVCGMEEDWWEDTWYSGDDHELSRWLESAIASDPGDLSVRCVALSAYWVLANIPYVGESDVEEAATKERLWRQLRHFVLSRNLSDCTDAGDVFWEISNAGVVGNLDGGLTLARKLKGKITNDEFEYVLGRLNFQFGFSKLWTVPQDRFGNTLGSDPSFWYLRGDRLVDSPHRVSAMLARIKLCAAALDPILSSTEPERRRIDCIHDAIKDLGQIAGAESYPEISLMLGRCHFELGNYTGAADVWRASLAEFGPSMREYDALEKALDDLGGSVEPSRKIVPAMKPMLYSFLAEAYERAGRTPDAIRTVEEWITEFPEHLGTYERLSTIYAANCDPAKAYDWLRKEVDRNPAVGEDPNRSLALQLGVLASDYIGTRRVIRLEAEKDPDGVALIRQVITLQWPALIRLPDDLRDEWVYGIWGQIRSPLPIQKRCRDLVRSVTLVLEAQLRDLVFERFRSENLQAADHPPLDNDAKLLWSFLKRKARLGLGQMFVLLERAQAPDAPIELRSLHSLVQRDYPRIAATVEDSRRVVSVRNRATHSLDKSITEEETCWVYGFCCRALDALQPLNCD